MRNLAIGDIVKVADACVWSHVMLCMCDSVLDCMHMRFHRYLDLEYT